MPFRNSKKADGVLVFWEGRSKRLFVGVLKKIENRFHFEYDRKYLRARRVLSLGPELPLTRQNFDSETLFVPFSDRIPSRENPAYVDYCAATGISPEEKDPIQLLPTIAHRGPSSFIFEPLYEEKFTAEDLLQFRKSLGLTVKEFAACFDFSPAAITRTEKKQTSGREVLKRAAIYARHPTVALEQMQRRGGILHTKKRKKVELWLQQAMSDFFSWNH